ncbi:VCBS repeat-containing protein [Larkinella insperata]|uniref:VCBS repeat-containing protein n=1 Tax=Larkinella insperata TaxID=332158 RepID=A0ABW3Q8X5_9BACT|nr:VCBS repeat-containing protein [Larkinella insperata]
MIKYIPLFLIVGTLAVWGCRSSPSEKPLFHSLDSTQTGVGFVNQVQNTARFNIIDYLYFYNGAGVAAGDINNDGLTDLYFVSNQGKNKLYLNKGGFKFEDITRKAGVEGAADWQTGVTMADVNGDGWLDIYVCSVGNFQGQQGSNELYINNQDGTFSEKAAEYGLNFTGFSTQAAFFDYDHDGDLDMYLLNHAVHTSRSYDRVSARNLRQNESGDYLFRNELIGADGPTSESKADKETPHFTNVSEQAGIYGAAMGYGLGISVADLNNDGWEDIYVSNDFHEDDYYYVNNGKGGFTESVRKAFAHVSRFSMGNDIADVNNDGFQDVVTLDMYPEDETVEKMSLGEEPLDIYIYKLTFGYMNQYSRNCLQINQSGRKFMDVGAMAGVAATDWSWAPLLADYDNDGIKDLFVANGIVRRPNDLDYVKFTSDNSMRSTIETSNVLDEKAIAMMPEGKVHNYLFQGSATLKFTDKSLAWGFEKPTFSSGAVYADLDNDGDLDLITNDINDPAGVFQNQSNQLFPTRHWLKIKLQGEAGNSFGVGAKVVLKTKNGLQLQQLVPTRGFQSSVEPALTFGLGELATVDSLIVIWPNQKMEVRTAVQANQTLTLRQTAARQDVGTFQFTAPDPQPLLENVSDQISIAYQHQENTYFDFVRESLMPFKVSTEGPKLAVGDVNGDGLEDFYAAGAKWQAGSLQLQQPDGRFVSSHQPAFRADSTYEDVDAVFFDADGDKDLDLYVVSGGNEFFEKMPEQFDRLYLNDGKGNFTRSNGLPPMYDNKSCVRPVDFDNDGDLDLFVGGRVVAFAYGKIPNSYLLINDGKGRFSDQTDRLAPELRKAGMITDAVWMDYDQDKDLDLVVAGDWMPIRVFAKQNGKLEAIKSITDENTALSGFWQCLTAADFDRDGDLDLVAGNLGLNTKFIKQPDPRLKMWVKDFDKNGSTDQILAYQRNGKDWHPVNFKDELGKQMPSIVNKRFTDYTSFAGKPLENVFEAQELEGAEEHEVNQFASVFLENRGDGHFIVHQLPMLAQVSKLFALRADDIDNDGFPDVLAGGNFYGVSTYQGRYDANYGLVLKNRGGKTDNKTRFSALSPFASGFLLEGEVRDIKPIRIANSRRWLVARNDTTLQIFQKAKPAVVAGLIRNP